MPPRCRAIRRAPEGVEEVVAVEAVEGVEVVEVVEVEVVEVVEVVSVSHPMSSSRYVLHEQHSLM